MIKKLSNEANEALYSEFELIDFGSDSEEYTSANKIVYNIKNISVFDHWLSDKEYEDASVICYGHKANEPTLYENYEKKFLNFYSYLYDHTQLYARLFSDHGPNQYVTFSMKDTYMSHVLLSVREQLFLKIVLPEYHAIIDGGFDLTHLLRVKKDHPESLVAIEGIVRNHGLYVLD